uniref:Putative LOV domain-containing protein n=1 Tax=Odontosoria sp. BC-2016 TaxID=1799605 RepID=A0A126WWQ1_9MONI|nr:putative LOV domain-containing protein [Odontosoria sp. BC-2016]
MGRRVYTPSRVPSVSSLQQPGEESRVSSMLPPITQSVMESMSQVYDTSVQRSLKKMCHHSFVITDPHLHGHPIVYASDAFLHMSGYTAEEVLGRNPKFLQGPDTDRQAVFQVRDAIHEARPCNLVLLNYTKQGWPYQIVLHMAPVFSQSDDRLLHFVGAQVPLVACCCSLGKRTVQSAPFLLGSQSDTWLLLGRKFSSCSGSTTLTSHLPSSKMTLCQTGSCTGLQKKKKLKVAQSVLQLVVYELNRANELKWAAALHSRYLSENADTALCSSLTLALQRIQQSFVICNPRLPGIPVVYASDMFVHLTGYQKDEVMGCNCRFLQGQNTDALVVQQITDSVKEEKACTVRILNYRKNGQPFWNLLHVAPVRDHTAKTAYFVGVQWELSSEFLQTGNIMPVMGQLGAVGAIKVAFRSLQSQGLCRYGRP